MASTIYRHAVKGLCAFGMSSFLYLDQRKRHYRIAEKGSAYEKHELITFLAKLHWTSRLKDVINHMPHQSFTQLHVTEIESSTLSPSTKKQLLAAIEKKRLQALSEKLKP